MFFFPKSIIDSLEPIKNR